MVGTPVLADGVSDFSTYSGITAASLGNVIQAFFVIGIIVWAAWGLIAEFKHFASGNSGAANMTTAFVRGLLLVLMGIWIAVTLVGNN